MHQQYPAPSLLRASACSMQPAAVLLCCCAAVLLCCCAAVLLCCCAAVLLCCCAAVRYPPVTLQVVMNACASSHDVMRCAPVSTMTTGRVLLKPAALRASQGRGARGLPGAAAWPAGAGGCSTKGRLWGHCTAGQICQGSSC